jgi:predicted Rossmann-fold nucleotide-binding protein
MPVVLMGTHFWNPLIDWLRVSLLEAQEAIGPEDLELFEVTDDIDHAVEYITKRTEHLLKAFPAPGTQPDQSQPLPASPADPRAL